MRSSVRLSIQLAATAALALAVGFGAGYFAAPREALPPSAPPSSSSPATAPVAKAIYKAVPYSMLAGWQDDDLLAARETLEKSCKVFAARDPEAIVGQGDTARPVKLWRAACDAVLNTADDVAFRAALTRVFEPFAVTSSDGEDQGTFTGYYESELRGSLRRDAKHTVPIYGMPRDLVSADLSAFMTNVPQGVPRQIIGRVSTEKDRPRFVPYFTRAEIDAGAVANAADVVLWAEDPVDVHILHIQGSGRVTLTDGDRMRLGFAGSNGQRFQGIGSILLKAGVLKAGEATMDNVRTWLRAHPEDAARYMRENGRFIFFQLRPDDAGGPIGALGVPLTAGRSLAVDPEVVPLGAPLWLASVDPDGKTLQRLVFAQDIGAAITGAVRGDYFWGTGEAAFQKAARMKSRGRYAILLPQAS